MPGKCVFNDVWLQKKEYKSWLQKDTNNKHSAVCLACYGKTFDIGNMGEYAIISHNSGAKHKKRIAETAPVAPIESFLITTSSQVHSKLSTTQAGPSNSSNASGATKSSAKTVQSTVTVCGADVLRAEVIWVMKCVNSHISNNASTGINRIFKAMFPDSSIAAGFGCGERKAAYLATFGLGPYFAAQLLKNIQTAPNYVLLFDETLNKELQEKQLDVYIRFWNKQLVVTKFFDSKYMGHATAADLFKELSPLVAKLGHRKLLQLAMDGPNVNLSLAGLLLEDVAKNTPLMVLDIGTCGLHTLHNAFRDGCSATGWDIETLLSAAYYLFHDCPARREDFLKVSGVTEFPLKFCRHRWLENVAPAERLLRLLPNVVAYCTAAKMKKVTEPSCKSYRDVLQVLGDPLIRSKLEFFVSVAKEIEPFLAKYQTDRPLIPFLAHDLNELVKDLMIRVIEHDVVARNTGVLHLLKLNDKQILLDPSKVDIGFEAKMSSVTTKASDKQRYTFRVECRDFIQKMLLKILAKTPVRSALVRSLGWLNPTMMAATDRAAVNNREELLEQSLIILADAKRVKRDNCDLIKKQYRKFCDSVVGSPDVDRFRNFNSKHEVQRVDELFAEDMPKYKELWDVTQMLLLLSHGQATVERGFSVHKQTTVENLSKDGLKARRLILQAVREAGDASDVAVTTEMLSYASSARSKYQEYLDAQKKLKEAERAALKRKAVDQELSGLKKKRQKLTDDARSLQESADRLALDAADQKKMSLLVESNALRKRSKELQEEAEKLKSVISEKESK